MAFCATLLLVASAWITPVPAVHPSERHPVNAASSRVPRSGPDWVFLDQSPINGKAFNLATDPRRAGRLYVGGQGVFRSDDFGGTWSPLNEELRPEILLVDSSTPDRLYVVSGGSIWRSVDTGATWSRLGGPPDSVTSFLVDAAGTLFADGLEGAFKSATAGNSWSPVTTVGRLIAADPVTPGVLYAFHFDFATSSESIFKTTDGAASWTGPLFGVSELLGQGLTEIKISPAAPLTVYLGTSLVQRAVCSGSVLVSRDGGATWKTAFFTGAAIAADPVQASVIYAGTFAPCGSSTDPGGVYQVSSTGRFAQLGQRAFVAQSLAVAPDGSRLYAIAGGDLAILHLPAQPKTSAVPFR
jgi:hypothetical protein